MKKPGRQWSWMLVGLLLWWSAAGMMYAASPPPAELPDRQNNHGMIAETSPITRAFEAAIAAAERAQSATASDDWSAVASGWATAIQSLQAVSPDSPERVFAQRKAREYLANQAIAQRQAEITGAPIVFPDLGSEVLNEQLGVYLSYLAIFGPPDVMVIGSSRALQGINPQILQQRLTQQGFESVRVYTFAVNGATAQVVSFILRRLLTPEQMPRMIVWAGGSRSFNSARTDRTFAAILDSPGYAALEAGERPGIDWNGDGSVDDSPQIAPPIPVTSINGYGFLAVDTIFDPETYYQTFPRVPGRYDASYQSFSLEGVQTVSLRAIAAFAKTNAIPLVFINLPLSSDYLDETRLLYEQQFQAYLQREAIAGDFMAVDLLQQWSMQNHFFADPSHLNQIGAAQIAVQIAENPSIPWQRLASPE